MAKNKWLKEFQQYEDAVDFEYDPYAIENSLALPSPSLGWVFANKTNRIPKAASILLSSEPKAGKSLFCQAMTQKIHEDDPEGLVLYFNTELRGKLASGLFKGIDKERMLMRDVNSPTDIFDFITKEIEPMLKEGMPLRMVVIDSLTNIQGRRGKDAESIENIMVGDKAITLQTGLERIVPIFKKYNILFIATVQKRANLEMNGNPHAAKTKTAASWATKHTFEYFLEAKKEYSKDNKTDLLGNEFVGDVKDLKDNKEQTGHKISFKLEQSSLGVPGRTGMFTLEYKTGITNTYEEVFVLGKNTSVIDFKMPRTYTYKERKFTSKEDILMAIKDDKKLYESILADVIAKDAEQFK